ncbi:acyl-CoA thioesterase [Pararhizobium haloflavum]|uniref:acyl-CoA thioesterase n=1 Tax=Pararhizobium haloflavum TaxID=2037914 RepID=UPI000C1949A1|nr:thioesterase family protein [Pararhizobium haloflavum]
MAESGDRFVHDITVRWSDCDPANIAYTGRIPNFALEAIDAWWAAKIGIDWFELNLDRNTGTPFVKLSMEFLSPITPRHTLRCTVRLTKLGRTAMTFAVDGHQDGKASFAGEFVCVAVQADRFKATPLPEDMRLTMESLVDAEG